MCDANDENSREREKVIRTCDSKCGILAGG